MQKLRPLVSRATRWDILVVGVLVAAGSTRAVLMSHFGFGFGDISTFFSFANNLVHGESLYRDFIHFRMPGAYYLYAAFLKAFGSHYWSLVLAMGIESYVLYPILLYTSARLLTGSRAISTSAALPCLALPGIFQLRAVIALLAVALYCRASKTGGRKGFVLAGAVLAADLMFGQETFIMAAAVIGIFELARWGKNTLRQIGHLAAGFGAVIIPFLVLITVFSSLRNFIYYGFDYALLIQPKYMNLPFPHLSLANFIFYLPFVLYIGCFAAFYAARRLTLGATALLAFALLRMVSALGRADGAHLLFSIPEAFIIVPWAAAEAVNADWRRLLKPAFLLRTAALIVIIAASMRTSSSLMLLCVPVLAFGLVKNVRISALTPKTFIPAAAISTLFFAALFSNSLYGSVLGAAHAVKHPNDGPIIDGTHIDEPSYSEVRDVSAAIKKYHPETLFSYPIQAYYYTLAPHHASRFMTFEPQTTKQEERQTIADLQKTRPQVVVMDMLQSEALSASLSDIHNYVTDHYTVVQRIVHLDYIHILVPKPHPSLERHLLFNMYPGNAKSDVIAYHVDNYDGTVTDGLQVKRQAVFSVKLDQPAVLQAAIGKKPQTAAVNPENACGEVFVSADGQTDSGKICMNGRLTQIDLRKWAGKTVTIKLMPTSSPDLLWVDPTVVAVGV